MSTNQDGKTLNAFLARPEDWQDWEHELQLQAETYSLYDHMMAKKPLIREPTMPDIRRKRYTKTAAAARTVQPPVAAEEPEDDDTIQEKVAGSWMMSDLTEAGQRNLTMDLNWYKQAQTTYNTQKTAIEKLKKWIFQTVAPVYKTTCCEPRDELYEWYSNLKSRCGMTNTDEKVEMREVYKAALKPPRNLKDATEWINRWENTMAKASSKGVPEAKDASSWAHDLLGAVNGIMPMWATSYRLSIWNAIADGSLKYRDAGNDFRQELATLHPHKAARISRGVFAATYAGKSSQDSEDSEVAAIEDQPPSEKGRTSSRQGRGTRRRSRQRDSRGETCIGCGLSHDVENCFYLFPEKAPRRFRPNPETQARINHALENDADLQAKVRSLKRPKSKAPGPPKENPPAEE
ncbi:hypothetical protein DV736_g5353, partial [Chaetothyriales sp. CBS 134916]